MFLRKNGGIEKSLNSFAAAPPEKKQARQIPSRISTILQSPLHLLTFWKNI